MRVDPPALLHERGMPRLVLLCALQPELLLQPRLVGGRARARVSVKVRVKVRVRVSVRVRVRVRVGVRVRFRVRLG